MTRRLPIRALALLAVLSLGMTRAQAQDSTVEGDWKLSGGTGQKKVEGRVVLGRSQGGKLRFVATVRNADGSVEVYRGKAQQDGSTVTLDGAAAGAGDGEAFKASLGFSKTGASGTIERGKAETKVKLADRAPSTFSTMSEHDAAVAKTAPDQVQNKYDLMSGDPFVYFRGNADVFYRDMKAGWMLDNLTSDKTTTWLSGDLHLANLGVVPLGDKSLAWAFNDFDEAAKGPYILDLQRLTTSISLAADALKISREDALKAVDAAARSYYQTMKDISRGKLAHDWAWTPDDARGLVKQALDDGASVKRKDLLDKLVEVKKGKSQFKEGPDVTRLSPADRLGVKDALDAYVASIPASERGPAEDYKILDVARKTGSGTGSLGLDRFWVLIRGNSDDPKDAHVLEWKEERPSAVEMAVPDAAKGFADDGARVVAGERALIGNPDRFLGHTVVDRKPFLVRELSAHKAGVDLAADMTPKQLEHLAVDAAASAAHSHAFSDADGLGRGSAQTKAAAILEAAGTENEFASAVTGSADAYAQKTRLDWERFRAEHELTKLADEHQSKDASELVKALEKQRGEKLSDAEKARFEGLAKAIRDRGKSAPEGDRTGIDRVLERDMERDKDKGK